MLVMFDVLWGRTNRSNVYRTSSISRLHRYVCQKVWNHSSESSEFSRILLLFEDLGCQVVNFFKEYTTIMDYEAEVTDCLNITFEDSLDLEERFENDIHLVGRLIADNEPS
ncbi:unnamed protein product [Malus baccata var. baccata]